MSTAIYRNIILFFTFCFLFFSVKAQKANSLYFLENTPSASLLNPAFSGENDFVIGLPFVSGVNIGFHNDFKLKDAIQDGYGFFSDTMQFNFNSFYGVMGEQNRINFEADISMFYLGIRKGKNFYSVSVNEKAYFRGDIGKPFIEYFTKGTKPYYGNDSEIGNLTFNIGQYREYGLGISRKVNKKFTYGARIKLLFGRIRMASENLNFKLKTSESEEALYLTPSGNVEISGPVRFETDTLEQSVRLRSDLNTSDYFFNFSNLGMATDLGIKYQYNSDINFSVGITDVGFLRFSKKNYIMEAEYELRYAKDSLTQASDPERWYDYSGPNSSIYAFRDSIPFMTSAAVSSKAQIQAVPVKLYIGANYLANRNWTFGFVGKMYFLKDYFYSAATISAQTTFNKNFKVVFSNSIIRNSLINPGFACSYESDFILAYFATDNIYSVIAPSGVKNLNLQFGVNLLINSE